MSRLKGTWITRRCALSSSGGASASPTYRSSCASMWGLRSGWSLCNSLNHLEKNSNYWMARNWQLFTQSITKKLKILSQAWSSNGTQWHSFLTSDWSHKILTARLPLCIIHGLVCRSIHIKSRLRKRKKRALKEREDFKLPKKRQTGFLICTTRMVTAHSMQAKSSSCFPRWS